MQNEKFRFGSSEEPALMLFASFASVDGNRTALFPKIPGPMMHTTG